MNGADPVAATEAVPSEAPRQDTGVELMEVVTLQDEGIDMLQGTDKVLLALVALKAVAEVAVPTYATKPEVVTHVKPTFCPATKLVLVIVSLNLPTTIESPGLSGQLTAEAEFPKIALEKVDCINLEEAV